jgi:hypothetical protein
MILMAGKGESTPMRIAWVLRLLALATLVCVGIRLAPALAPSSPASPLSAYAIVSQLNQPVWALLQATGNALGLVSGIVALVVCVQGRRWTWFLVLLLLVLACIYVPVVVLTIGPIQGWWNILANVHTFVLTDLISTLAAPAVTALVTLALTLWRPTSAAVELPRLSDPVAPRTEQQD